MNLKGITSPNFEFLKEHDALLVQFAMQAERYCFADPNTSLIKLRQFAELLAGQTAAYTQTYAYGGDEASFNGILRQLKRNDVITGEITDLFYLIKDVGNKAVHEGYNDFQAAVVNEHQGVRE